jgi:16S rRNA (cytosine967-C5)-methyltransferase
MQNNSGSTRVRPKSSAMESLSGVILALSCSNDECALPKQSSAGQGPLLQNLLFTISRRRASFDFLLDKYSQGKIRPRLRRVLWWALAELYFLDGLPDAIVVDTATGYVKKRYSNVEAGFVNALLRRLTALGNKEKLFAELAEAPPFVRMELPEELYLHWRKIWPEETIARWAELWQRPAEIILRRCRKANRSIPAALEKLPEFSWAPDEALYRLAEGMTVNLSELLSVPGEFYIQDPSTLLAPALLSVKPGEEVADLCCAPGGKSLLLAEALDGQGMLYCRDRSATRLDRARENLAGHTNVNIVAADALQPDLPEGSLHALLLDVPCSNTGVIRRRPDVRWTWSKSKLQELVELQAAILDSSGKLLCPGGRLVYSTCSIEPQENAEQTAQFLLRNPEFTLQQEQQLFPDERHDGAYAALMIKRG